MSVTTNFEEVEGRPLFNRFAKADSMKAVPPPLSGDYTPLSDHIDLDESQMSYGTKSSTSGDSNSVSNDFVSCDNSGTLIILWKFWVDSWKWNSLILTICNKGYSAQWELVDISSGVLEEWSRAKRRPTIGVHLKIFNKTDLNLGIRSMDFRQISRRASMQRTTTFESDSFIYWKNRFETYVKSKDLDLWHVITDGDFQPIVQNPKTKLDEIRETTSERQKDIPKNETTKTAKVKGSALDAEIQIILLENVQSHRETRTKEHLLEVLGAIAVKKMMKRSKTRHVL
ncbi:hypothetical protein Tco_1517952 [Tanacetum coccineum]